MVGTEVIGSSAFNLSALVISVTCIVYKLIIRGKVKLKNWLFIAFIMIIAIDAFTGIVEQFLKYSKLTFGTKLIIGHANLFVYFLTHFAMAPIFVYYIVMECGVQHKFTGKVRFYLGIPFIFMELLVLINPLFNIVYRIDDNLTYVRRSGVYIAYGIIAFYTIFSLVVLYLYWAVLNKLKKIAIIYFYVTTLVGLAHALHPVRRSGRKRDRLAREAAAGREPVRRIGCGILIPSAADTFTSISVIAERFTLLAFKASCGATF